MKSLSYAVSFLVVSLSLIGCSTISESKSTRALFETRAEAEKASKDFNCTGAHKMGDKWMPCNSHDAHDDEEKHEKHGGHNHHHHH